MESVVIDRLDCMSSKLREGVTMCRAILAKLEEGSLGTKKDEIRANRLRNHYDAFLSEIQMLLQGPPSDGSFTDLKPKLREYTSLQLETSEVLSDLDVYLSHSSTHSNTQVLLQGNTSQLPKLDIPKFDGNVLHWHAFWDKFTSNVISKNLSDVDKFSYLEQALEGEASRAIGGLDTTNSNYKIAVERLKERFAKPGILKDSHYVALQLIPRASSDVSECRKVLDEIEQHLQVLKSLGEDTNHTGLRSTILDKFPGDVLHDLRTYTKSDDESVDVIRDYLKQVISTREDFSRREAIKTAGQALISSFTTEAFFAKNTPQQQQTTKQYTRRHQNGIKHNSNFNQSSNIQKRRASDSQGQAPLSSRGNEPTSKRPRKSCFFCSKAHFSDTCRTYPTIEARKSFLKNRCFQCFSNSHLSDKCERKMNCRHCGEYGVHNRALCPKINHGAKNSPTAVNFSHLCNGPTILQTVRAPVSGTTPPTLSSRILFDTGSERSYISQSFMKRMKLKPVEQTSLTIYTFGCKRPKTIPTALVGFGVHTLHDKVDVSAYAVPTTTNDIPAYPDLKRSIQNSLPSLHIADDADKASQADIIIGNDFYHRFISSERKEFRPNLFLINSKLGWVVSGAVVTNPESRNSDHQLSFLTYVDGGHHKHSAFSTPPDTPFQYDSIRGLWELETIGITDSPKVFQDDEIVTYFNRTTVFEDGRYYVKWPWVQYPPDLPVNYGLSYGRLKSLLKRIDTATLHRYNEIFQDQLEKGVIEIIQEPCLPTTHPVHYLPHHCVIQEHKSTKMRVVYDASAKVQGQCSLNDFLYKGPLMLEDLTALLLAFRTHRIALTADIEKAFLQVGLQSEDRDATRFLWLKDLTKPPTPENLLHLRFCRVPFGIVSSPYLLAATIRLHLQHQSSPLSGRLSTCLYVDNLVTGAPSTEEALRLYHEARTKFTELSMNIREWCSNEPSLIHQIPEEQRNAKTPTTVLGIKWDQKSDQIMLSVKDGLFDKPVKTKRQVSHVVASVFDPCGFAIPLTIGATLFLQNLWKDKIKWDTPLPEHKLQEWNSFVDSMKYVAQLSLPRFHWSALLVEQNSSHINYQLHCFADASREAYAAAVYLRVSTGSNCVVSLSMARLRLTPIRYRDSWTIPKLELMAVLIGTRLLTYVQKALTIQLSHIILWTDSQVVLGWLKSDRLLPPFVTRRVAEIKKSITTQFRYVPSLENPADIATRHLKQNSIPPMWFKGPDFLTLTPDCWPCQYNVTFNKSLPLNDAMKWDGNVSVQMHASFTTANDAKDPDGITLPDHGIVLPLNIVHSVQRAFFPDEFAHKPTLLAKTMGLFIDEEGCLRCKGRFQHAELTNDQKCPILLPKGSRITVQLILRIHEQHYHVGVTHTLSLLRQLYWVPHGRALVKSVLASCHQCKKYGGGPYQLPGMPDLPESRVSYSSPFTFSGLDYLGPLTVTTGGKIQRRWICLFTCMAVRAVHLEVVGNLTAEEFTLALRRFIAARGAPSLIVSDNAAQFKTTASVLQSSSIGGKCIEWKFIPELSPRQGGFYERLVGLIKHCLRRSLDRSLLRDEQLLTVVKEIESILNTRPLTTVGDDLGHVLTPSDFLKPRGAPLLEPPTTHHSTSDIQTKLVQGWKHTQNMLLQFRKMFVNQYLVGLREHLQFCHKQPRIVSHSNPHVGDVVLVKGDSSNRAHWAVAKIKALLPSRDGLTRSARVLLPTGRELTRSISHLYPLEIPTTSTPDPVVHSDPAQAPTPPPQQTLHNGTRLSNTPSSQPSSARTDSPAQPDNLASTRPQRPSAHRALQRIRQWTRSMFVIAVDACGASP